MGPDNSQIMACLPQMSVAFAHYFSFCFFTCPIQLDYAEWISCLFILKIYTTGAGKSYLAQALGQAACRRLISTRYIQLPDLLEELHMAKAKDPEPFHRLRKQFVKYDLLIIDEWLLFPISEGDAQILLSLIDRRHNYKATIIASQYEPAEWLDQIPIPVAAEAITDRLSAQAYRITLDSKNSMRLLR